MKHFLRTLVAGVLAIVAMPACVNFDLDGHTRGDRGEVKLSYDSSGFDCLLSCGMDMPVLLGTSEVVVIESATSHTLPQLTPVSDDPTVITVDVDAAKSPSQAMFVRGLKKGSAQIRFLDSGGATFDTTTMRVEPGAAMSVGGDLHLAGGGERSLGEVTALDMSVGDDVALDLAVTDDQGEGLAAWGGRSFSVDDPTIADHPFIGLSFSDFSLTAKAQGTTTLRIAVGELTREIPITVR